MIDKNGKNTQKQYPIGAKLVWKIFVCVHDHNNNTKKVPGELQK